jgi:hypothetical protein
MNECELNHIRAPLRKRIIVTGGRILVGRHLRIRPSRTYQAAEWRAPLPARAANGDGGAVDQQALVCAFGVVDSVCFFGVVDSEARACGTARIGISAG